VKSDLKKKDEKLNAYQTHELENTGDYNVKESRVWNFLIKIFSVILAFGVWIYAMSMENTDATSTFSDIPVKIMNIADSSLSVISGYDYTVDVTVKGKKNIMHDISADAIEAYVDASSVSAGGRYTLDIHVNVPGNLSVVEQSISSASVYIDKTTTKSVPISVKYKNFMLDGGYELGSAETNISEIKVEGPNAILELIVGAQTTLELGHITNSMTVTNSIELIDSDGNTVKNPYVTTSVDEVQVTVPLYMYKDVPLEITTKHGYWNSDNVKLRLDPAAIRIQGEPSVINNITRITLPSLDEKKVLTDTITQSIILPEGVTNTYGIETVKLSIEHIGTTTKDITIEEFAVNNPNGLHYTLLEDFISVKLRGPSSTIGYLSANNIRASIDLSSYTSVSGTIFVPVTITVIGAYGQNVYELGEYKISVFISQ